MGFARSLVEETTNPPTSRRLRNAYCSAKHPLRHVTLRYRVVALVCLLAILGGLFVWAGTVGPDPTNNDFPGPTDIHENPDEYVGSLVTVSGTVTSTDPLTIETEPHPGETRTFVVENANDDAAVGDRVWAHGPLRSEGRVDTIHAVHREPWELSYMFAVSVLAGLWVLARFANRWTVDTTAWAVVPRREPLLTLT